MKVRNNKAVCSVINVTMDGVIWNEVVWYSQLVSWCFEPSQLQRIISGHIITALESVAAIGMVIGMYTVLVFVA